MVTNEQIDLFLLKKENEYLRNIQAKRIQRIKKKHQEKLLKKRKIQMFFKKFFTTILVIISLILVVKFLQFTATRNLEITSNFKQDVLDGKYDEIIEENGYKLKEKWQKEEREFNKELSEKELFEKEYLKQLEEQFYK